MAPPFQIGGCSYLQCRDLHGCVAYFVCICLHFLCVSGILCIVFGGYTRAVEEAVRCLVQSDTYYVMEPS